VVVGFRSLSALFGHALSLIGLPPPRLEDESSYTEGRIA
jgi:hypothetical protein